MRKVLFMIGALGLVGSGAFAADLSVESQFSVSGKDATKAFLTVQGAKGSVQKDTLDAVSGASHNKGTAVWNGYAKGADKKAALPLGLQNVVKYGVSPEAQFADDGLTVAKAADGVITIQYVHFGYAFQIVTDKTGAVTLPAGGKSRQIAVLEKGGANLVAKEFSPTGKVADIDWAKVWDDSVGTGAVIAKVGTKEAKVGKVVTDTATSANAYAGTFKITFDGTWVHVAADLTAK